MGWAHEHAQPVHVLGGGSNLVIADGGVPGLLLQPSSQDIHPADPIDGRTALRVGAALPLDQLVTYTLQQGLFGLECLSGIPGHVGATPIQNVGAYGAEVADTIIAVEAQCLKTGAHRIFSQADCAFGYRDSYFRRHLGSYFIHAVTFALQPTKPAPLRYRELQQQLSAAAAEDGQAIRNAVLTLRRSKGMVLDPADPHSRSAGSFFKNPIVAQHQADAIQEQYQRSLTPGHSATMPRYPAQAGYSKLSAAWLIEQAGLKRGTRRGPVGISARHSLALVHYGGGRTADLLALAREVQGRVLDHCGVQLAPEPIFLGFKEPPLAHATH